MLDLGNISRKNLDYLFFINSEISNIGTKEQYSEYLKTIFTNSLYQDVYFHRTKSLEKFDTFEKKYLKPYGDYGGAFYFAPLKYVKRVWVKPHLKDATSTIYPVKLNIENPYIDPDDKPNPDDFENISAYSEAASNKWYNGIKDGTYDSVVDYYDDVPPYRGRIPLQIAIYDSDKIHILGSKKDLDGFRNFVKNNLSEQIFKKILLNNDDAIEIAKRTQVDNQINEMKRIMKYLIK
jgi:hypothetical protein